MTMQHYRIITGACEMGCKNWMETHGIKENEMMAKYLLPILEATNAYGYKNFKKLVTF